MERFLLHIHYKAQFDRLTNEQAGRLIKAVFTFVDSGEIEVLDDAVVQTALWFICKQIEEDGKKYRVCGKGRNRT